MKDRDPVWTETRVFVDPWETRIFGTHTAMMALSPQLPLPRTPSTVCFGHGGGRDTDRQICA